MNRTPDAQLSHLGLYVRDMAVMTEFYSGLLGLVVTDSGPFRDGSITFMSRNPDEHHQLVLVTGRPRDARYSPVSQISFRVGSLEDVQFFHAAVVERAMQDLRATDHGNAWSIYFLDPEGNRIEIYAPSPWYVSQPCQQPLDIAATPDVIRAATLGMVEAQESFQTGDSWRDALRKRLA